MSSVFEGLKVKIVEDPRNKAPNKASKSIFEGLNVVPLASEPPPAPGAPAPEHAGAFGARTGKSLAAGALGGLADAAAAVYNIPAALTNAANDLNKHNDWEIDPVSGMPMANGAKDRAPLPLIPSAMEAIDQGIDEATQGRTRTPEPEKWFQEGIKFAASTAFGGGLGSLAAKAGLKGAETALKAVGSAKPSAIIGAGASGAAMQKAQERDISAPGSIGVGLGSGLAAQTAATAFHRKTLGKLGMAGMGFGRSNLNLPALDAAQRLNIDLPGIAATKGVAPAFVHQFLSKFPYWGDKLRDKIKTASQQEQKAWETMLDSVGPPQTKEVSKNIDRSYELMRSALPEGAVASPAPLLEAIARIEENLKTTVYSEPTKKLLSILGEFKKACQPPLPDGFEKFPPLLQKKILEEAAQEVAPIPVKGLVRLKVELNKIMKDRNIFDRCDTDALAFLRAFQGGNAKALETYGATNPRFMKTLKRAEERFARTARREALDDALAGKIADPKTGEASYASLLSVLNDRKQQKFLRNNLGEANYKKLKDFVNVAKAMDSIKRNNPNPSGSASMGAAIGLIVSLCHGKLAIPAATIGGGTIAARVLTSKKFLNLATQFAKEPAEPLAQRLAAIVKEDTGMTLQALQKAMRDSQEDEG